MTVYHAGELAVQHRLGQSDIARRLSRMVRDEIPAAAADFLTEQPMAVLAATDDAGRVWAGLITGPVGFMHADDGVVTIEALPVPGDPLHALLNSRPRQVGMIAIEPQSRHRMRINGIATATGTGLSIHPDQVYSNCPKYISRRHIERVTAPPARRDLRRTDALDDTMRRRLAEADTFLVGSADPDGNADASHRGGNPGFLEVLSPTRLRWPDYRGNSMFMTLGNIATNPSVGLLIPDWDTGSTLQLTGTAEIVWESAEGVQCFVEFDIAEAVEISDVSPLHWSTAALSPANPA
ncbi:pyridoxamine 5'-phosphate oxidase family protein [Mycolicibacterium neoaurum]|uniref:pyridoxamine 5'-phosphate oxidase family protein n=1 Tax=Mycolicibacterium neoaurum TaxID=1795 RepID=UPI002673E748|nr:pyridoxamine 5'-phosphate oxidase family protein [Mycolicibacterium neoaurum]MDO3399596.1 pyridoxamine 5'-phosphate oxidase family protein [Mycolicibacterium neoaurum]